MCKFLGKLLFVLIFLGSAVKKIQDPTPFSNLLIDRYERFQNLATHYNMESLGSFISLDSLKIQANQINTVVGIGQIVISLGILLSVPYISLFFGLFLISTIVIIHNPLYFEDRDMFFSELGHMVLEIGMIGITFMFAANEAHEHGNEGKKKKKKGKGKEKSGKNEEGKKEKKKKNEDGKKIKKDETNDGGKKKKKKEEGEDAGKKKKKN